MGRLSHKVRRARLAFETEGLRGVVVRIGQFFIWVARHAAARAPRRRGAPLSVAVILRTREDAAALDSLLSDGWRPRRRWLREVVVIAGAGLDGPSALRSWAVPSSDPAILANAAAGLATGDYVAFVEASELRGWTPPFPRWGLWRPSVPDLICVTDGTASGGAGIEEAVHSASLTSIVPRRRPFMEVGMFRPESGAGFVTDLAERMWRGGYHVSLFRTDKRLVASERSPERALTPDAERPVRVMYFMNGTDVRGGVRIVFEHCNRLRDLGIETMVASFDDPNQTWFPDLRAPIVRASEHPMTDVAIATFWTTAPYVARLDCARFYFIQHDESLFEDDPDTARQAIETYDLPLEFVTISDWLVDLVRARAGKDALLVPNGINREMFYPDPAYPKSSRVRVLIEGNKAVAWKGMPEAEEAVRSVDVEVWSLGKTGIESDRSFDYPPQDEVRRVYSSCDILLKTSWYEGMPLPHMEAMACACALLTTAVPGVRDYCIDGVNCVTCEPRNIEDIKAKLAALVGDPELRARLIAEGLRMAADSFGWDDKMETLAKAYVDAGTEARIRYASRRTP